ncbi:MAG: S8 family serine peptidase, partial [candidate division Zixibacteria bacterium]|nr:S8 family serine peptidase [candidate division Zixibacteria bacterium]
PIAEVAALSQGLTREEARSVITERLKTYTAQRQSNLQSYLNLTQSSGKTRTYRSISITNQIIIEAQPLVFQTLQNRTDIHIVYIEHPAFVLGDITWNVEKIKAPEVWSQIGLDGSGVIVGVVDQGTDYGHSDLHANIWNNLGEDADGDGHTLEWDGSTWILDPGDLNEIDDDDWDNDPTTFVDDLIGWNFPDDNNDPDPDYHGTFVAGVIAGDGSGGTQTGVAPKAKLMILKSLSPGGSGVASNIISAIDYGLNNCADILNLSLGWIYDRDPQTPDPRRDFRYACDVAAYAGLTICAIAGNEGESANDPNADNRVPHNIRTPGDVPSV